VEGEIRQEKRSARAVEEHDLVHQRSPSEDDLVDGTSPVRGRGVAELGVEAQIPPLLGETGRGEEPRIGVGIAVLADEEVVHLARRDDAPDGSDRSERLARRPVEPDG